jgi:Glycosyl transferase family 64 domain
VFHLVKSYSKFSNVIVVNNGVPFNSPPKECTLITSNSDLGLFSRFAIASLCLTPAVAIVDDDLEIPEMSMRFLYEMWKQKPDILHGIDGRCISGEGYGYGDYYGQCPIVLTRGLITTPEMCAKAMTHIRKFQNDVQGVPVGNGEDILLSFVAGGRNMAYPVPITPLPDHQSPIHKRIPNHLEIRNRAVNWCLENL